MKRLLLLLAVATLLIGVPPAQAHHDSTDHIDAKMTESVSSPINIYLTYTTAAIDKTQLQQTTISAANTWDAHLNGINLVQSSAEVHRGPDIGCADVNYHQILITWVNLGANGPLADGKACITNPNIITSGFIRVNSYWAQNNQWNLDCGASPASYEYDYCAVATHEFGHVLGFTDHWLESWDECPGAPPWDMSLTGRQTMCPSIPVGKTYARSLGTHDTGEFNDNYTYWS